MGHEPCQDRQGRALSRSTVQRIVGALVDEGFIATGVRGGRIRLDPKIAALAEHARYYAVETRRLILTELSQDTGETAGPSVLRGDKMIFLDQVPGVHRLPATSSMGVAFRGRSGTLYAISAPIPSSRFPRVRATVETSLVNARKHAAHFLA